MAMFNDQWVWSISRRLTFGIFDQAMRVAEEVGDVKHLVSHDDPTILVGVVLGNLLSADWHCRADGYVESGAQSKDGVRH